MMKPNAILVSVDYADLLEITMPYNRHHFDRVLVVTTPDDKATQRVAGNNAAEVYTTESFYSNGAAFNKWVALEEGLDRLGRSGWLCIMDADVLWPRSVLDPTEWLQVGNLYTPMRRMLTDLDTLNHIPINGVPMESSWVNYPLHPQQREFAGYTQLFYASDSRLPKPPWHEVNWRHAGGADSFFQGMWPDANKVRPPFQVLHLGDAGKNWCGRATPYLDGTTPEGSAEKVSQLRGFLRGRKSGPDRFAGEKL